MTKCDLGFCTLAGTLVSDSAATGKIVARRWVNRDSENYSATNWSLSTKTRPPASSVTAQSPRGANYVVFTDIHCMPRQIAEILDHSAADLAVCPRIYTHPHIHRDAAVAGIASRPASAFHPSFHPSSP